MTHKLRDHSLREPFRSRPIVPFQPGLAFEGALVDPKIYQIRTHDEVQKDDIGRHITEPSRFC